MNKQQKTYTAFIESVCKKFNRPDMAPALKEGFQTFCEADDSVNENGQETEHLGDIKVILDPNDNDGKSEDVAAVKFLYNGKIVGREYIFIGKNKSDEYDCGKYFNWKGIETLDNNNMVHGLGGLDDSIIKNSEWFKNKVSKHIAEEADYQRRREENRQRYITDPTFRRTVRKQLVDVVKAGRDLANRWNEHDQ